MTKPEKVFLAAIPLPLLLCFYSAIPVLSWFRTSNLLLSWLPVNIGLLMSFVMLVLGIRRTARAIRRRQAVPALLFLLGTLVSGVPALGMLVMFVLVSLNLFQIHQ